MSGKISGPAGWVRIGTSPPLADGVIAPNSQRLGQQRDAGGAPDWRARAHAVRSTDNTSLLLSLVLHGVGIARLNDVYAMPLVREGRLVPLLQDHFPSPCVPIFAVMLQERHRLPKIRACIDYWAEWVAAMTRSLEHPAPASRHTLPPWNPHLL